MDLDLNNRETAAATIILAFFVFAVCRRSVRRAAADLIKCALHWKIAVTVIISWAYAIAGLFLLNAAGLWDSSLMKDAVLWILFSGGAITFSGISESDPNKKFLSTAKDQAKGVLLFEFLVNVYAMSYAMELVWQLMMLMVSIAVAVRESQKEGRSNDVVLRSMQGVLGLWILGFVAISVFKNPDELFKVSNLQAFFLPIFLALWILPLGCAVSIVAGYEAMFIRLDLGQRLPGDLRFYSRLKLIELGRFNSSRLRRMQRLLGPRAANTQDHEEVDLIVQALGETMEDPILEEAGDFVWPPASAWNPEPSIKTIEEYRRLADPLLAKMLSLEALALETISDGIEKNEPHEVTAGRLLERITEVEETVEKFCSFFDLAPRVRKLDRRYQDYAAAVDDFYRHCGDANKDGDERWLAKVDLFADVCRKTREKMRETAAKLNIDIGLN